MKEQILAVQRMQDYKVYSGLSIALGVELYHRNRSEFTNAMKEM